MARSNHPGKLYSIGQIQDLFLPGLSYRAIGRLIEIGDIESYKVGKKRLVSERAIKMYISTLIPEPEPAEQQGRMGVSR